MLLVNADLPKTERTDKPATGGVFGKDTGHQLPKSLLLANRDERLKNHLSSTTAAGMAGDVNRNLSDSLVAFTGSIGESSPMTADDCFVPGGTVTYVDFVSKKAAARAMG